MTTTPNALDTIRDRTNPPELEDGDGASAPVANNNNVPVPPVFNLPPHLGIPTFPLLPTIPGGGAAAAIAVIVAAARRNPLPAPLPQWVIISINSLYLLLLALLCFLFLAGSIGGTICGVSLYNGNLTSKEELAFQACSQIGTLAVSLTTGLFPQELLVACGFLILFVFFLVHGIVFIVVWILCGIYYVWCCCYHFCQRK